MKSVIRRLLPYVNFIVSCVFLNFNNVDKAQTDYLACFLLASAFLRNFNEYLSYKRSLIWKTILLFLSVWLLASRIFDFLTINDWDSSIIVTNCLYISCVAQFVIAYILNVVNPKALNCCLLVFLIALFLILALITALLTKNISMFCVMTLMASITASVCISKHGGRYKEKIYEKHNENN